MGYGQNNQNPIMHQTYANMSLPGQPFQSQAMLNLAPPTAVIGSKYSEKLKRKVLSYFSKCVIFCQNIQTNNLRSG